MKQIIVEDGEIVNSNDFEEKANKIIEQLDNDLFKDFTQENTTEEIMDKNGNITYKKKQYKKNDIMPIITPTKVDLKLDEYMIMYRPMSNNEARSLEDMEYLQAFKWYLKVVDHINDYIVFLPNKQAYCAFANITTDIYNDFMQDPIYSQVFKRIDDTLVKNNFLAAETDMVDSKTTLAKLSTKDAGHNLVKNPESITFIQNNKLNREDIERRLEKFNSIARIANKK